MECVFRLRFGYGKVLPWVRRLDGAIVAVAGPDSAWLRTPVRLTGHEMAHQGSFTVRAGERVPFVMSWQQSHLPAPGPVDAMALGGQAGLTFDRHTWSLVRHLRSAADPGSRFPAGRRRAG
jgi:hypothetical protein